MAPRPPGSLLRAADGTLLGQIQLGLFKRRNYVDHSRVKLEVHGQGCVRGFAPAMYRLLVPSVVLPAAAKVGVDIAVDFDAPSDALMIIDSDESEAFRKLVCYSASGEKVGGNVALGSRSSSVSATLYDKLEHLRKRMLEPHRPVSDEYLEWALPKAEHTDVTRFEIRVRHVSGIHGVEHAVRKAARRFLVADLRRAKVPGYADVVLLAMARRHGLLRGNPGFGDAGLGNVAFAQLRRSLGAEDARLYAKTLQSRALALVMGAAELTAFNLESRVADCWSRGSLISGFFADGDYLDAELSRLEAKVRGTTPPSCFESV